MKERLQALEPLVGEWSTTIKLPGRDETIQGLTTSRWLEGGG